MGRTYSGHGQSHFSKTANKYQLLLYFSATHIYANSPTKKFHAKYDKASPSEVVSKKCTHLSPPNQSKLLQLLSQFSCLFSGSLGQYVHRKLSISLKDPNVTPIFCNPYPIPLIHQQVFQKQLQHLVDHEKFLRRIARSEWAFTTFLIPTKDGRVRWIRDFHCFNKLLKYPRYFHPSIPTIMQKELAFPT